MRQNVKDQPVVSYLGHLIWYGKKKTWTKQVLQSQNLHFRPLNGRLQQCSCISPLIPIAAVLYCSGPLFCQRQPCDRHRGPLWSEPNSFMLMLKQDVWSGIRGFSTRYTCWPASTFTGTWCWSPAILATSRQWMRHHRCMFVCLLTKKKCSGSLSFFCQKKTWGVKHSPRWVSPPSQMSLQISAGTEKRPTFLWEWVGLAR